MDSSLRTLLKDDLKAGVDSDQCTHVTMFGPQSNWMIGPDKLPELARRYPKLVYDEYRDNKTNTCLCLAQKVGQFVPLISEFEISINGQNQVEDFLPEEFVAGIVTVFQHMIKQVFVISDENFAELMCGVLQPSSPTYEANSNQYKYYFKLHFPYCVNTRGTFMSILRPLLVQQLTKTNLFRFVPEEMQIVNKSWDIIMSNDTYNNPILMYGSVAQPNSSIMRATKFYGFNDETIEIEVSDIYIPSDFDPAQRATDKYDFLTEVPEDVMPSDENDSEEYDIVLKEYYLPLLFSLEFYSRTCQTNPIYDKKRVAINSNSSSTISGSAMDARKMALDLVSLIQPSRFTKMVDWTAIGKALHVIYDGDETGLTIWQNSTPNNDSSAEINRNSCADKWLLFASPNNNLTLRTIATMAKLDSPKKYEEWHARFYAPAVSEAINNPASDVEIAMAVWKYFWLDYVCSSSTNRTWYKFNGNYWIELDNAIELRTGIKRDFRNLLKKLRESKSKVKDEGSEASETEDAKTELSLKNLNKLIARLSKITELDKIIRTASDDFYEKGFAEKLDINPYLLGLKNGVIELGSKEAHFRRGSPDDYISRVAPTSYSSHYHWNHPDVLFLLKWYKRLFPNDNMRKSFRMQVSSCLRGRNVLKRINVWKGPKCNNGKSTFKSLIDITWGPYSMTLNNTYFTQGGGKSNEHSSDIMAAKYARWMFAQEFDDSDKIRKSKIKPVSGME